MNTHTGQIRSVVAYVIYALLNPIPYGFFVGALIFDATYASNGDVLWVKAAAWLITFGLLFAIIPRLINLVHVWLAPSRTPYLEKVDFWLNLVAILVAIVNAFVHSRDAYAAVPEAVWLSAITVLLLVVSTMVLAAQCAAAKRVDHE
ncbi:MULTISPECIES: DUF2231 domain-containing protein [Pandoraea]|uniref:DUF2231 domain-containing protein n=1 Tax=Pandoraea TaxID=93217 RepID=UPI001F5D1491|nr:MULTISPECIES: DUF2231 domain-containing protein [Pandoraea]MCI3206385.1 hypothetical protein [Pandoraea sp. LA3]MDN4584413.1 hypothetical protein [Pandoraea capi]